MAWLTFGTQTSPEPMSNLDVQFANAMAAGIVGCTASGTNVITLTPILSGYTGPAYANNVLYGFLAANTTNGVVTLKVGALAALNVYQANGTTQLTTGDIVAGQYYIVSYNAALNSAAGGWVQVNSVVAGLFMKLATTSQAFSGGVLITPAALGNITSFTVNPGLSPLQYGVNHGAATWTAPVADGACDIYVLNDGSAGTITFSGFTVSASTGDALTTTNTSKFFISIRRINSVATYLIKALQ